MRVSDIMIKNVITAGRGEEISKVLKKMEDNRIHQLPIVQNGKILGIIFLKDIIRFAHDVEKNTAERFLTKIPAINAEAGLQEAVQLLFRLGVRAVPVVDNDKIVGIISETDLIKNVEYLADISPDEFMGQKCFTVGEEDRLGRALEIMSEQNVSRVPVVDYQRRVVGCIDNLSLIKFLRWPKESIRFSHLTAVEPSSAKEYPVKDYMRGTVMLEMSKFSLKKIVELLQTNEEVIITESMRPLGVVTPRDVLELVVIEAGVPLHIARLERIDPYDRRRLDDTLRDFVRKIDKFMPVQRFFIYVDTHEVNGRKKYSLRASFFTEKTIFRAISYGWDIWEAIHMLLENLERQIMKYKEKKIKQRIKTKDGMKYTEPIEEAG